MGYEEIPAFPLEPAEIEEFLRDVRSLLDGGIDSLLVFHYPRNWRIGEAIWTPVPANVQSVKAKPWSVWRCRRFIPDGAGCVGDRRRGGVGRRSGNRPAGPTCRQRRR